jgi:hypothetical protein
MPWRGYQPALVSRPSLPQSRVPFPLSGKGNSRLSGIPGQDNRYRIGLKEYRRKCTGRIQFCVNGPDQAVIIFMARNANGKEGKPGVDFQFMHFFRGFPFFHGPVLFGMKVNTIRPTCKKKLIAPKTHAGFSAPLKDI